MRVAIGGTMIPMPIDEGSRWYRRIMLTVYRQRNMGTRMRKCMKNLSLRIRAYVVYTMMLNKTMNWS